MICKTGIKNRSAGESACQGFNNGVGLAGDDGADVYIERKREMMSGGWGGFALGDGGGFAHGFDEFAGYVFAFHGLILRFRGLQKMFSVLLRGSGFRARS